MDDHKTALRLALHIAGQDHLLPEGDFGDDLYDRGLMRDEHAPGDMEVYTVLTPSGEILLRAAIARF
jgi:hypothetical protein